MDLGSFGTGINNLLQNRLFLQYLSGGGGAIAAGQPVAPALNAITQQNIGAQSQSKLNERYIAMMSKMFKGEVPTGGKMEYTDQGVMLKLPKITDDPGSDAITPDTGSLTSPGMGQIGNINPFSPSQPSLSASDLAGLGPQDVSRALAGATSVEGLRQQSINNLLRTYEASHGPLEQTAPITFPDGRSMTLREMKALPTSEREYYAYRSTAKKLGAPEEELTREFYNTLEPTEREKFARAAMEDPSLMAAAKELAQSGATRISIGEKVAGKVAEKKALGKISNQLHFGDPKWIDEVGKYVNSEDMQRKLFMEAQERPEEVGTMKAEETIKYIENKITSGSGGGTIQDVRLSEDGRTMTWTVKWPSGDVEDISYDVGS